MLALLVLVAITGCTTDRTRRGYLRAAATRLEAPPSRPVVIIPGFGVSRLFDPQRERYVWGTAHAVVQTRYGDDLDLPLDENGLIGRDSLVPRGFAGSRGPVNIAWQLSEALVRYGGYTRGSDLHTFAYDWRLTSMENAERLHDFVERVRGDGSVDIITHSAGALLALTYVKLGAGGSRVDRLILIAPPQRGVVDAIRILVRPEQFIRRRFTLPMVATWPSVFELLPDEGQVLVDEQGNPIEADIWTADDWQRLRLGIYRETPTRRQEQAFRRLLADAREFRARLRSAPLPAGLQPAIIAGDCVPTAQRVLMRGDGSFIFYRPELRKQEESLLRVVFEDGDGTVPISSANPSGEALLFCDGHQGIAADPNVHRAILRLLR